MHVDGYKCALGRCWEGSRQAYNIDTHGWMHACIYMVDDDEGSLLIPSTNDGNDCGVLAHLRLLSSHAE